MKTSFPFKKLLSSDARNATTLATCSSRPRGVIDAAKPKRPLTSFFGSSDSMQAVVSITTKLTALTRILRPFKSDAQVRARDRTAASFAL
jgi:hypothetical protein